MTPKLRPYLALDLETTGLDTEKSQILQIGWVIDDGVSPRDKLLKGSVFIRNKVITYGEDYALGMNDWIFRELMKKGDTKYPTCSLEVGTCELMSAILKTTMLAELFDRENGGSKGANTKIQLAGKNVSNFDWPIVLNQLKASNITPVVSKCVDHRFLDCGAVFFDKFGFNPGFNKINELIGWKEINHDALDDAMNVVVALRYCLGMNF